MTLIPDLPAPALETEWHSKESPYFQAVNSAQKAARDLFLSRHPNKWFVPKMMKMDDGVSVVDYSWRDGEISGFKVTKIEDHPFLGDLPANAPRAVKHMYRKEVRVRYLGVFDYADFMLDTNRAEEAREAYNSNLMAAA